MNDPTIGGGSGAGFESLLPTYSHKPPAASLCRVAAKSFRTAVREGPLGMSKCRLAKEIDVLAQRIGEIASDRRAVTDLRLCRLFGLSDGWWLHLQADCAMYRLRDVMSKELTRIRPWNRAA